MNTSFTIFLETICSCFEDPLRNKWLSVPNTSSIVHCLCEFHLKPAGSVDGYYDVVFDTCYLLREVRPSIYISDITSQYSL